MALDKTLLATALKTAFEAGAQDENWTAQDAADAMADAIDAYVRAAVVAGITTDVVNLGGVLIGHGTQTGNGTLN